MYVVQLEIFLQVKNNILVVEIELGYWILKVQQTRADAFDLPKNLVLGLIGYPNSNELNN